MSQRKWTAKKIAMLAMFTALCVVARTAFAPLPNVQPVTAIFLILVILYGTVSALIVSELTMFITSLYMGMGYWVISQFVAYAVILILMGLVFKHLPFWTQVIYAFAAGMIYGFVASLIQAYIFGVSSFLAYYLFGVSFDLLHAVSTGIFFMLLLPMLKKLFQLRESLNY